MKQELICIGCPMGCQLTAEVESGVVTQVSGNTCKRGDAYAKVQKYSFANIDRFSTGSLVTRLTNDVTQLQNFVNMLLRMALPSSLR